MHAVGIFLGATGVLPEQLMIRVDLLRGNLLGFPLLHGLQEPQGKQRLLSLGEGFLGRPLNREDPHVGPEAVIKEQFIAAAQHPKALAEAADHFG